MIKKWIPVFAKNYLKSIYSWRNHGEFSKSVTRFIDHRGLQVKRYILVPFFNLGNPRYYSGERRLFREIKQDCWKSDYFKIDREIGFAKVEFEQSDLDVCISYAEEKLISSKGISKNPNDKEYLRAIADLGDLGTNSRILEIFTSDRILESVSRYLGAAPILADIVVLHSPESEDTAVSPTYKGSQLYHRDGDGIRVVKVWILCKDVEIENGPTVLLPSKISDKIAMRHFYRPGDKIKNDKWFSRFEKDMFYAVGTKGTALATDTISCFHMGSRTGKKSSRLVLMAHFVTPYSGYFRPRSALSLRNKFSIEEKDGVLSSSAKILLRPYIK